LCLKIYLSCCNFVQVYVPLDFDSRYVGKEVIGVFGNGIGKSGMSLFLAGLTSTFGNFGMHKLSFLSTTLSMVWLSASFRLSNLLPQKDETDKVKNKVE
jgi:ATP/ADP translocase